MKKIIIIIILLSLNFIVFYYLTEYTSINTTFEEITLNLIASIIVIPFGALMAAYYQYAAILSRGRYIAFKKVYKSVCLNVFIFFYAIILLIAIMVYFKLK